MQYRARANKLSGRLYWSEKVTKLPHRWFQCAVMSLRWSKKVNTAHRQKWYNLYYFILIARKRRWGAHSPAFEMLTERISLMPLRNVITHIQERKLKANSRFSSSPGAVSTDWYQEAIFIVSNKLRHWRVTIIQRSSSSMLHFIIAREHFAMLSITADAGS